MKLRLFVWHFVPPAMPCPPVAAAEQLRKWEGGNAPLLSYTGCKILCCECIIVGGWVWFVEDSGFFISHLCMDVCASWVFVHDYKTSSWLVIPTWYICTLRCDRQIVTMGGWFYYRFLDLVHDCLTHGVHLTKSYRRPRRRDNYPIVLSVWQCNTGPAFIAVGLLKVRLGTVAMVSTQI